MLKDIVWVEKYRPKNFNDLVFNDKDKIIEYLKRPESMPSFIFYSSSPGTGKTSTAKIIAWSIGADLLKINASDERGIDVIREKVTKFCQNKSSIGGTKRLVFLDEADGLTKQAQESMKSLMETYSNNAFFILSCNDLGKIIEPIRKGRCLAINFANPNKEGILARLKYICEQEGLKFTDLELNTLVHTQYPDMRSMILALQNASLEGKKSLVDVNGFNEFLKAMKDKNIKAIYETVYNGKFDILGFNRYYFQKLFEASDKVTPDRLAELALILADTEKSWTIGANLEIVFIANILQIMRTSK